MKSTQWGFARESTLMLLESAILAPSSHNTQPWLFRVGDGAVEVLADRTRALPVNDPYDRELTMSCGCALFNLRVAAIHAGFRPTVRLLPRTEDKDLLATIHFEATSELPGAEGELFDSIAKRQTHRLRFDTRLPPDAAFDEIRQAADFEGAALHVIATDADRAFVAALVAEGDHMLWGNPSWRRELAAWTHPRRDRDGIVVDGLPAVMAQAVIRTFDMGHGIAAKDKEIVQESPILAVLATQTDNSTDWMVAGQALQRTLLTAQKHGLQASFLNQPIQVASLRTRLANTLSRGVPQILIRMGYPITGWPHSRRRSLDETIDDFQPMHIDGALDASQESAPANA